METAQLQYNWADPDVYEAFMGALERTSGGPISRPCQCRSGRSRTRCSLWDRCVDESTGRGGRSCDRC